MSTHESVVYFVRLGEREHVKIGFSTNFESRLRTFRTLHYRVIPLLTVPGDRALERQLHELLAEARIAREIFHRDWRVQGFIDVFNYAGLERALQYLKETTPKSREQRRLEERAGRTLAAQQTKAEKDAYFASLVRGRKERLGW